MSGLPMIACPSCSARMSLDVAVGHQGARDALLALAQIHPSHTRFAWTALRYVGLFAPAKQEMRWDRIAGLLREIAELVSTGKVERGSQVLPAPLDYWILGMEDMLAGRDRLRLPLKGHGYLLEVVIGMSDRAAGRSERAEEDRKAGRTQTGGLPVPAAPAPISAQPTPPARRGEMPTAIRDTLKQFSRSARAAGAISSTAEGDA